MTQTDVHALAERLDRLEAERAIADTMYAYGRGLDYGLAYHRPLPTLDGEASQNLFWFVEGLGRVRPQDFQSTSRGASWEVLPGLHWRLSDSWWLSGGVVFPVGASRSDTGLWQFTCSWQF